MTANALRPPTGTNGLVDALSGVRALVLDADGVLLYAQKPLPGAVGALDALESAGIPYRVVTNYSLAHRDTLAAGVSRQFGRPVRAASIITAASAAAAHTARHHPGERLFVLASPDALREWAGQRVVGAEEAADIANPVGAVVIGDAGDELLRQPERRVPCDPGRRRVRGDAPQSVVDHATGGHPRLRSARGRSRARPRAARDDCRQAFPGGVPRAVRELAAEAGRPRLRRSAVAMVGDDLETDIAGAHRAGLRAILVLSGKTDEAGFRAAGEAGRLRGPARPDGVASGVGPVVEALIASR